MTYPVLLTEVMINQGIHSITSEKSFTAFYRKMVHSDEPLEDTFSVFGPDPKLTDVNGSPSIDWSGILIGTLKRSSLYCKFLVLS